MVAPAAPVLLGVAFTALTSTILGRLCLTVGGVPRGLAYGRLPRAAQRVPAGPGSGRLRCELPGEPRGELSAPKPVMETRVSGCWHFAMLGTF